MTTIHPAICQECEWYFRGTNWTDLAAKAVMHSVERRHTVVLVGLDSRTVITSERGT